MAKPQGIDLNLDKFDLSNTKPLRVSSGPLASWGYEPQSEDDPCEGFTPADFWSSLNPEAKSSVTDEDRRLLAGIFNPAVSDRRDEGDMFLPPAANEEYVAKLRTLLKEEAEVQEQRRKNFLSRSFSPDDTGMLFPYSWRKEFMIKREKGQERPKSQELPEAGPPSEEEAARLEHALRTAIPTFDKATEEGVRFRIYRVGSLEVRTIQEQDGKETIGAVFSSRTRQHARVSESELIVEVTHYVDRQDRSRTYSGSILSAKRTGLAPAFFVVYETEAGNEIMTERLPNGLVTWAENPQDLEARCALAKVTGSSSCRSVGITVRDARALQDSAARFTRGNISEEECRAYASGAFFLALPVWEKCWTTLTRSQRNAAEQLGVFGTKGWDARAAAVWQLPWVDLEESQRSAARSLGLDESLWLKMRKPQNGAARKKRWSELTDSERKAAMELCIANDDAWDAAPEDKVRSVLVCIWERSWGQLTEEERNAAKELGITSEDDWNDECWTTGGVWETKWSRLSEEDREAVQQLGIKSRVMWEKASADRLGHHWGTTPWDRLSAGQKAAAGRRGYNNASWSGSKA